MSNPSLSWVLKMAWRDGRKSWKRLLLSMSATSIGIAALVAAGSLQHNLEEALRRQAKPLVGADISIRTRRPFTPEAEALVASLPYTRLRETEITTVVYFPTQETGRLLEVRAVEKGFPFYGDVRTEPANALPHLFTTSGVLIEENVMVELGLRLGDPVEIGQSAFTITGALKLVPGEAMASVFSAPHAFIDRSRLSETGLIQQQSLARHKVYFKTTGDIQLKQALSRIEPKADEYGWRVSTVEERQRSLGQRAENAGRFLRLCALIALLLGGIGVASVLFVYAKDKWPLAATLKCLGVSSTDTLLIFIVQGLFLGAAATAIGAALGLALQWLLPVVLRHFVRVDIPFFISWAALTNGAIAGFTLSSLFSLFPLLSLRSISALAAIRFNDERPAASFLGDRVLWGLAIAVFMLIFLFAKTLAGRWSVAAAIPLSLGSALLLLSWLTHVVLKVLRSRLPLRWPFVWRQGLANLFRPHNQTYVLVAALGLGSALIFTISFLNQSLLRHIAISASDKESNLALIDIQRDQRDGVRRVLDQQGAPIVEEAPFVTMRIQSVKGAPVEEMRGPTSWAFQREYRSTYRNTIGAAEQLRAGSWPPPAVSLDKPIPISLEEGISDELGVTLGDEIVFNVQGVPMTTTIVALRNVDWFQLRPNFFVIFPTGVLEDAPQFNVILARSASVETTANVQRQLRAAFPNVSTVDLRMVMETLQTYFGRVAFALTFMSFFVIATGFMILAGALISGRAERLKEAALLRTLGAASGDVRRLHLIEYGLIGFFAGGVGLVLGLIGSFAAARYGFQISLDISAATALFGWGLLIAISIVSGLLLGRGAFHRPPLETLREEE